MDRRTAVRLVGAMMVGGPFGLGIAGGCTRRNPAASPAGATGFVDAVTGATFFADAEPAESLPRVEARYYEKLGNGRARCLVCPLLCELTPGQRAPCHVRLNDGGRLRSVAYGNLCNVVRIPPAWLPIMYGLVQDPFLFLGNAGCNFTCDFCMTAKHAFARPEDAPAIRLLPEAAIALAERERCGAVAFSYTEAVVNIEYVHDLFELARRRGMRTVLATNGFVMPEPLADLLRHTTDVQLGLKGGTESFYNRYCGGRLAPVLDALVRIRAKVELLSVGYLVIPGFNSAPETIERIFGWIAERVGPETIVELYRFMPLHLFSRVPPTPKHQLLRVADQCRQLGFHHVLMADYLESRLTNELRCPRCQNVVLQRDVNSRVTRHVRDGRCAYCGRELGLPA